MNYRRLEVGDGQWDAEEPEQGNDRVKHVASPWHVRTCHSEKARGDEQHYATQAIGARWIVGTSSTLT